MDPLNKMDYYVVTNYNAPMWKLIKISIACSNQRDCSSWKTIINEDLDKVMHECKISKCGYILLVGYIERIAEVLFLIYLQYINIFCYNFLGFISYEQK
jgi:hypothetical protein